MNNANLFSAAGVILILSAFFALTFKMLNDKNVYYYIINALGGMLACYGSILLSSIPFTILEGTWTVVAAVGIIKNLKKTNGI